MKIEITSIKDMMQKEEQIVDYHSLINVLNVIAGKLQLLDFDLENQQLKQIISSIVTFPSRIVSQTMSTTDVVLFCNHFKREIKGFFAKNIQLIVAKAGKDPTIHLQDNLDSIFHIMDVRLKEFEDQNEWKTFNIDELLALHTDVLKAVEKNSDGRYKITFERKEKNAENYLIHIGVKSPNNTDIHMPNIFNDVFRDLLLNSRKYTPIGGEITGELVDNGETITVTAKVSRRLSNNFVEMFLG